MDAYNAVYSFFLFLHYISTFPHLRPMAECAAKVIEANGFSDRIKLVRKRSTELTVGPGCDLEAWP